MAFRGVLPIWSGSFAVKLMLENPLGKRRINGIVILNEAKDQIARDDGRKSPKSLHAS